VHDHNKDCPAVRETAPFPDLDRGLDAFVAAGTVRVWWTGDTVPLVQRDGGA
jgi:hypothetical protein